MADTMTLEELRESLDVGCLPNTDRPRWFAAIDAAIKQRERDAKDTARYRWLREADQDKVEVYFANSELPGGWNDWNAWANKDDGIDHYMQESGNG